MNLRQTWKMAIALLLCGLAANTVIAQRKADSKTKVAPVKDAKLGETRNVHQCGELFLAGQPTKDDIAVMKKRGVKQIITLRTDGEVDWDEAGLIKDMGMQFVPVPFRAPDSLTPEVFDKIRKLLKQSEKTPTVLHCGSANRVGAVWMAYRVLDQGVPLKQAQKEAKEIGLRTAAYEEKALEYIRKREKEAQPAKDEKASKQASVKPGINDNFLNPEMQIESWIGRFETESREIFANREAILAAMPLKPGMRVADVGAGTGFFSRLFADRVGPQGWVYAVDISPAFLQHISARAGEQQVANLTPVFAAADSIRLPRDSVDLAFICDTYHHFEYPQASLASLRSAVRPGGGLVVIDFERIPGVSRDFILGHVRADKETFRKEIEEAGFEFLGERKIAGLKENYFLVFRNTSE